MTPRKVYTAIGLMSGTSLDGVDAALIETDGHELVRPKGFVTIPYQAKVREEIHACFGMRNRRDPRLLAAERLVTQKHIAAVETLLHETGADRRGVDLIGFHGQTIFHAPVNRVTVQIGDGTMMARDCRIDVIDDFRSADVAAGGEGAPLAPLYHAALVRGAGVELPVAILNIGGVANVTWIGAGADEIVAFDTGPGNALMDDWVKARIGKPFDADGELAAAGTPDLAMVAEWLAHAYFARRAPKSLDRNEWDIAAFGPVAQGLSGKSDEDGAATLLEFTAAAIAKSVEQMPVPPKRWYACGGGRHNKALMAALNDHLDGKVGTVEDLGWNGDATEAECFAYLAVRSKLGLPVSLPTTTNVPAPLTGGTFHAKS